MVRRDLAARGIPDRRVLATMASVPREQFVPDTLKGKAYADLPLPIGHRQTISQPYIVALMTAELQLRRTSRVLEIGTGSGYQTAILAKIAAHVWSLERVTGLLEEARTRLANLKITNVSYVHGDGAAGFADCAPYDGILVTAAAPTAPTPLIDQLGEDGRLIIPLGGRDTQQLTVYQRSQGAVIRRTVAKCRFVPLLSPLAFEE